MRRPIIVIPAVLALALAGCGSGSSRGVGTPTSAVAALTPSRTAPSSTSPARIASTTRSSTARTTRPRTTAPRTHAAPHTPTPVAGPARPVGGRVVVLNPGHNGGNASHPAEINRQVPAGYGDYKACDTTGTNTDSGYPEHRFNWDVALRVRAILQAHRIAVVLTRPSDSGVGPCVDRRAAIGNESNVAATVSIHADGAESSGHGFHVNQAARRPDGATEAVAAASVRLGQAIHRTLTSSSGLTPSNYIGRDGYYYRSDLAGLNLARRPATFLEIGNMRNANDAARLSSASGRARIASSVAAGILAYLRAG